MSDDDDVGGKENEEVEYCVKGKKRVRRNEVDLV